MNVIPAQIGRVLSYGFAEPIRQEPRVLLVSFSTMFITMGQGVVVPIIPLLVQSFGKTAAMVGIAVSAFALARVFANIPAGFLTSWSGARNVLVGGAVLSIAGNLLAGLTDSYESLVAFRFLAGAGSALYITAAVVFVADVSTPENRGRLMTIYQSFFLMGITLGPAAGGLTAHFFGLRAPFFFVAALAGLAGVWTLARIPAGVGQSASRRVRTPGPRPEATGPRPTSPLRSTAFVSICLIAFATFFTRGGTLFTLWPLLGEARFSMDAGMLGLMLTVPAAANLLFQPFAGILADKLGRRALVMPAITVFAGSLLVSAASPVVAVFGLAMVMYGVAQAIESPTVNAYVADIATPDQRPVALATMRTFGDVGLVIGAPLLGLIADVMGLSWGLVANAAIVLACGVPFMLTRQGTAGQGTPPYRGTGQALHP